jgi:hypothetical protein
MPKGTARQALIIGVLVALTLGCCLYSALQAPLGVQSDYSGTPCRGCDYAGPPIEALAGGHIGRFFATQAFMGPLTLVLRAPAVAVARSFGAGELAQYRIGSLVCLLLSAGLIWFLVAVARPRGKQWGLVALVLVLLLSGPVTAKALAFGHPEELVGALLCVVAVVLAGRGQAVGAGVSLGLAVATKQWALLAVLPVVIVCPGQRGRLLAVATGVAAVFILPMLIGNPGQFLAQNRQAGMPATGSGVFGVTATNIWFPYARLAGVAINPTGAHPIYRLPAAIDAIAHPAVLVLGFGLPLVYWWRGRGRSATDLTLLLALIFLLRCMLDQVCLSYHHLPFLVAIACYEALGRRKFPIISLYVSAGIWALAHWFAPPHPATSLNEAYLAWSIPLAAYLAYRTFATPTLSGVVAARRGRAAVDVAAETT